jgi:cytochrome c oxidase subunit 1
MGNLISMAGAVLFLVVIIEAFVRRRKGVANPWGEGATTLEWTVSSPPPYHTFEELPRVK